MADKNAEKKSSSDDVNWKGSARSAHQHDESAQVRDIERKSDHTPDEAEADLGAGEAEARRMRTKNET